VGLFRLLWRGLGLARRFALLLLLIGALALNVASLTVAAVQTAVSGALSAVGVSTVLAREAAQATRTRAARMAHRRIGRRVARNVTARVQRRAARSVASVFGEAIPVIGIAVIAGALALEMKEACDTAREMTGLSAALEAEDDPEAARRAAEAAFSCTDLIPEAASPPSAAEIRTAIMESPAWAWEQAQAAGVALGSFDAAAYWADLWAWLTARPAPAED